MDTLHCRYTGADLGAIVREASLCALEEDIEIEAIGQRHLKAALGRVKPSPPTSPDLLKMYARFQRGMQ
jgi:SpoVK/Ycf46/Vps4 family AAA+-type ATPase